MSRLPSLGPRGEGWFALQLLLLAAIAYAGLALGAELAGGSQLFAWLAGAGLIVAGGLVAALGIRDLGPSLSPLPRPTDAARLVRHGIYRRLRHPIYGGVLLAAFGWSVLTVSVVALVLCIGLAVLLDLKARREEAWLRERFAAYADYASRTSRFVPGWY
jgi:protein-S-isoprenylcysteine O-methyltransferase Ste14